jgi:hypothetical protein
VRHRGYILSMPRYLQLGPFTVLAAKRNPAEHTWNNFKIHFATAYHQQKKMQGKKAAASRYANAAVVQPDDDDIVGDAIDDFAKLATATAVDHGIVFTLTDANSRLTKQLEATYQTLEEIRALLNKERNDRSSRKPFLTSLNNSCWTHGYNIAISHNSESCMYPKTGHKREATKNNKMGGYQSNKE